MAEGNLRAGGFGSVAPPVPPDVWADRCRWTNCQPRFTMHAKAGNEVQLAVYGDHQVTNCAVCRPVALECGARRRAGGVGTGRHRAGVAAPDAGEHPPDGVTVIDDAYNANPIRCGRACSAGLDRRGGRIRARARRSWAVLGEMAELGADAIPSTIASADWRCA